MGYDAGLSSRKKWARLPYEVLCYWCKGGTTDCDSVRVGFESHITPSFNQCLRSSVGLEQSFSTRQVEGSSPSGDALKESLLMKRIKIIAIHNLGAFDNYDYDDCSHSELLMLSNVEGGDWQEVSDEKYKILCEVIKDTNLQNNDTSYIVLEEITYSERFLPSISNLVDEYQQRIAKKEAATKKREATIKAKKEKKEKADKIKQEEKEQMEIERARTLLKSKGLM